LAPSFRLSFSSLSVLLALLFLEREEGETGRGEKSRREKGGLTEEAKGWEGRLGWRIFCADDGLFAKCSPLALRLY
jgi:hypothetical protein